MLEHRHPFPPNTAWKIGVAQILFLLGSISPGRHPRHPRPKNMGKKVNQSHNKKNIIF